MMTTTTAIENNELETELQELFLIGKQWNADLSFIECELTILNKLFKKASFLLVKSDVDKLTSLNTIHFDLNKRIQNYFQQLEVLIIDPKHSINISLIDTYVSLEKNLEQALERLQTFKNCIFQTNKRQVKMSFQHKIRTPVIGSFQQMPESFYTTNNGSSIRFR